LEGAVKDFQGNSDLSMSQREKKSMDVSISLKQLGSYLKTEGNLCALIWFQLADVFFNPAKFPFPVPIRELL